MQGGCQQLASEPPPAGQPASHAQSLNPVWVVFGTRGEFQHAFLACLFPGFSCPAPVCIQSMNACNPGNIGCHAQTICPMAPLCSRPRVVCDVWVPYCTKLCLYMLKHGPSPTTVPFSSGYLSRHLDQSRAGMAREVPKLVAYLGTVPRRVSRNSRFRDDSETIQRRDRWQPPRSARQHGRPLELRPSQPLRLPVAELAGGPAVCLHAVILSILIKNGVTRLTDTCDSGDKAEAPVELPRSQSARLEHVRLDEISASRAPPDCRNAMQRIGRSRSYSDILISQMVTKCIRQREIGHGVCQYSLASHADCGWTTRPTLVGGPLVR